MSQHGIWSEFTPVRMKSTKYEICAKMHRFIFIRFTRVYTHLVYRSSNYASARVYVAVQSTNITFNYDLDDVKCFNYVLLHEEEVTPLFLKLVLIFHANQTSICLDLRLSEVGTIKLV